MNHEPSTLAIAIFLGMVGITLGISFYLGRKAKDSAGYFAAHGQIPWFVNGVAFAGDYLSAASFLGICGMIAFYGYDGFLYSIGYLAGWIVALFVVAEPMKRLGKFTFADALNAKFSSPGIKLAAGVSTLAVSIFYLIPQMVGAGVLVQPLLGLPHWAGVVIVGAVVIVIVVTAGMVSTTWVQFIKGGMLVAFSTVLTVMILQRGLSTAKSTPGVIQNEVVVSQGNASFREITLNELTDAIPDLKDKLKLESIEPFGELKNSKGKSLYWMLTDAASGIGRIWRLEPIHSPNVPFYSKLVECQSIVATGKGEVFINGVSAESEQAPKLATTGFVRNIMGRGADGLFGFDVATGPLGPLEFFSELERCRIVLSSTEKVADASGMSATIYYPRQVSGSQILQPGASPTFAGIRSEKFSDKLNFLSLMLALFCGTASLPHILIRYYTVKDEAAARKSTIVGIACIGFFYILTLYMGLGAMTSGALDVTDSNMAAPLLARSMSELLFAIISAIAFTTVLGTVSGLILASAGAVTHDLLESVTTIRLTDNQRVRIAKMAAVVVGIIAIFLGIAFKELNVSYLVGWAFSVAASANLPALVMLLFWRGTTKQGIIAAVLVGMISSLGWILLSGDTFAAVYGLPKENSPVPFSQPGIVTIPLGFVTLIAVSLATRGPGSLKSRVSYNIK